MKTILKEFNLFHLGVVVSLLGCVVFTSGLLFRNRMPDHGLLLFIAGGFMLAAGISILFDSRSSHKSNRS